MLNDFHETTRSVGVAGMFLGLLVVAGLCGLGMAVLSGTSGPKEATLENRVNDQTIHLKGLTLGLEERKDEMEVFKGYQVVAREVEAAGSAITAEEGRITEVQNEITSANEAILVEKKKFQDYRNEYRKIARNAADGEMIDLSETLGEDYKSVKITDVTPLHLRVMRSAGTEGIPFQKLPLAVQDRFQFGADEAQNFQKVLDQNAANRATAMVGFNNRRQAEQDQNAIDLLAKQINQAKVDALTLKNKADRLETEADSNEELAKRYNAQALAARRAGRSSMAGGQARKASEKAARLDQDALRADQESAKLLLDAERMEIQLAEAKRKLANAPKK